MSRPWAAISGDRAGGGSAEWAAALQGVRRAVRLISAGLGTAGPARRRPHTHYPVLVAAKGACPPEDCGGPWGYADPKEILADPGHEQHQEMLDWLGLDNPTAFDPNAIATDQSRRTSLSTAPAANQANGTR